MDWCHYRFRTVWDLAAGPDRVYHALAHPEEYSRWWPQIREVTLLDEHTGTARFRSLLPYDLVVTAHARLRDPAVRVLEAEMTGDLDGWVRWTLTARGAGTRVLYEQEVDVRKPLMRRLALPARPVFLANHALMMRSGRRGLAAHLKAARPHDGASPDGVRGSVLEEQRSGDGRAV
ncbi:SRPBCC family protein [Streptomyces sannanensis]|uniref:SRPBCC family protein n=1 Tax=Streptomyces sannanensis TaxID=285536 RepID=A0ABP6S6G7_9ACTN